MPDRPDPPDDLARRLRAEADRLEAEAGPIKADEARSATSAAAPSDRRWLPAVAAVVILAAVGATWLLVSGDDDPEQLIIPADPPSTTSTSAAPDVTTTTDPRLPTDWSTVPPMGIAIQRGDGPLHILDLDGNELFTVSQPEATLNGPSIDLPTVTPPEPVDPAHVPEGCSSAFGGGGIRVALCGDDLLEPRDIEVVDPAGVHQALSGPPFVETTVDEPLGHWRWALPSPDGQWVLAQWSGECEVPEAFLIPTAGGAVSGHLAISPAGTTSRGLGWTDDGRAIVELPLGACATAADRPGVYLLDPDTRVVSLVVELTDPTERAYVWSVAFPANTPERSFSRALDELGLEGCCGEPSHGGPDVTSGAVFEGAEIGVTGSPTLDAEAAAAADAANQAETGQEIQTLPLLHGEASIVPMLADGRLSGPGIRFDCGGHTWTLTWWADGRPEVDSMLLLAEALVPHLYCTLPPAPG